MANKEQTIIKKILNNEVDNKYSKEELLNLLLRTIKNDIKKLNENNFQDKFYLFKIFDYVNKNYLDSNLINLKYNYDLILDMVNTKSIGTKNKQYLTFLKNLLKIIIKNKNEIEILSQKTNLSSYSLNMINDFCLKMTMQINNIRKHELLKIDRDELIRHYEILLYEILLDQDTDLSYLNNSIEKLRNIIENKLFEIEKANNSYKAKKYLNSLNNLLLKIQKEIKTKQITKVK